ncbi:coenzyme PQQ synthesis protein D (PqqD) [Gramella sp. Hel_I_59]|uniref:PqqD family protein n=1 Tax=Gramella sp. Hel_I_59 TaxID=1249978 RepID=UPI001150ED95|nr:PqqD family protein [Gramella sp. Hel_I_59]TQI71968.1 coenzyme PQQ synthesis protein D (PqqD) [Gramella sp. Hel_I_59]
MINQVNDKVLSSKIGNEAVLMCMEAESYYGLDPIGSRIWQLLIESPKTIQEVIDVLLQEYDVDQETCSRDVHSFIDEMISRKLILNESIAA